MTKKLLIILLLIPHLEASELNLQQDPPPCLHYSIEWKVIKKETSTSKDVFTSKDTESDLVLDFAAYWQDVLKLKVNRLLEQKLAWNHSARIQDINVVVSAAAVRSERPLTKRFEMEID